MKLQTLGVGIAGCLLAVVINGCDQKTSTPPPSVEAPRPAVESAPAVQQSAEKAATEVTQAPEQAVPEVNRAAVKPAQVATEQTQADSSELGAVLTKAQNLVSEKKYQEALTSLTALKDVKLTETQQKTVDELKAQIQKYLATSETAKAVGNLLGK